MVGLGRLRLAILDRYVMAEILAPTGIGLLVFTFVVLINEIPSLLAILVSRGAEASSVWRALALTLPSVLALTIPMAFLLGVLLAFGRLASDGELVAMRTGGVSVPRLAVPVLLLSLLFAGTTLYVHTVALPEAKVALRDLLRDLLVTRARATVRPRHFTDDLLPGRMTLYVADVAADTGLWRNILLSDSRETKKPKLVLAREGGIRIDRESSLVTIELRQGVRYSFSTEKPAEYQQERFGSLGVPLPFDEILPRSGLGKSDREMSMAELTAAAASARAEGKPTTAVNSFLVEWHKRLAIPLACPLFGLLGLGLSLGSGRRTRSPAFGVSIAVLFAYFVLLRLGEQAGDSNQLPPWFALWVPDFILAIAAGALLVLNHREPAFDPLDPRHYFWWLPGRRFRRPTRSTPSDSPSHARAVGVEVLRTGESSPSGGATPRLRRFCSFLASSLLDPMRFLARRFARPLRPLRLRTGASCGDANSTAQALAHRPTLRAWAGRPTLLDRYVMRAWTGHFALVLAGFTVVYILASFMDLVGDVYRSGVGGRIVAQHYVLLLPQIACLLTPVAVLLSTLVTLGLLALHGEITALKAGGVSLHRLTLPVMALGTLAGLVVSATGELVLPTTNQAAARTMNVIQGRPSDGSGGERGRWLLGRDGRVYSAAYVAAQTASGGREIGVQGLCAYDIDPREWDLRGALFAQRGVWHEASNEWNLENGSRLALGSAHQLTTFGSARVRAVSAEGLGGELEQASQFQHEDTSPDAMTFGELRAHIPRVAAMGFDVAALTVQLHRKVAVPLASLVMTLLGIAFAFVVAKRGALFGVGVAVVLAIVYWTVLSGFEALGNHAVLPPVLAAWAPHLLFGSTGLYLVLRLDT